MFAELSGNSAFPSFKKFYPSLCFVPASLCHLKPPPHGFYKDNISTIDVGDNVTFFCNNDYQLDDSGTSAIVVTCTASEQLSLTPQCLECK